MPSHTESEKRKNRAKKIAEERVIKAKKANKRKSRKSK